tara:strand:- start:257 stop:457 length:201 start_codon:yes stop_codon:yes gene_type:complete
MATGECPSSTIAGYQFTNHYDCVNAGYGVAQKTFRSLEELEDFERDYIEKEKIAIKFECKLIGSKV